MPAVKKVTVMLSGGQASVLAMLLRERIRKVEKENAKADATSRPRHPVAVRTLRRCRTGLNLILAQWKRQTGLDELTNHEPDEED